VEPCLPQLRLDQVATPVARPIFKRIAGVCIVVDQNATIAAGLLAQLLRISYLRKNPWEIQPWKGLIASNSPGHTRIDAPVLITQGDDDKLVRPGITRAFVEELCREGEQVSYRTYPGVDQIHAGPETAPDAAAWIAARFLGKPARSTCQ
jgi:pimeloyl-ACP methyl ester carboxylesterase